MNIRGDEEGAERPTRSSAPGLPGDEEGALATDEEHPSLVYLPMAVLSSKSRFYSILTAKMAIVCMFPDDEEFRICFGGVI